MGCCKKLSVQVMRLRPEAVIPEFQTQGAAGCDLHSVRQVNIQPGTTEVIPTGLALAVPAGYELQVRPRSGLAAKHSLSVLNSPGTVDSDYRGEVKIIIHNHGMISHLVNVGDRIAQAVFNKLPTVEFVEVEELAETDRGSGGFGSTGS
jgi:dUTP pyrophosphatase